MTSVTYILRNGERKTVQVEDGMTIMDAAYRNDIEGIIAECGGSCACATCHVYVDERFIDKFSPADPFEEDMLEGVAAERRPNSRLSCQLKVSPGIEGIEIEIPEEQL